MCPEAIAPRVRAAASGRIKDAVVYSGFARSKLYELAAEHRDLFRKAGARVIVDYDMLDAIIAALPHAEIRPPRKRSRLLIPPGHSRPGGFCLI